MLFPAWRAYDFLEVAARTYALCWDQLSMVDAAQVVPLAMVPGLVNGTTLKMRVLDTGERPPHSDVMIS